VTSSEMRVWGIGVAQNFSASATDVFLGYRHFDADIRCVAADTANGVCNGAAPAVGTVNPAKSLPVEGIDVIVMGARVLF